MKSIKVLLIGLILVSSISLSACKKEGPIEKTGSRVDEIADNVKDGDPLLKKKGPIEKAGEAVDDAVGSNH